MQDNIDLSEYVGIPFEDRGRTKSGWDCWGSVFVIYPEKLGIEVPSYLDVYSDTKDPAISDKIQEQAGQDFIQVEKEQPGDIVLLRMRGLPWHVGIVSRPGWMLHTEETIDTVCEKYRCKKWEKRILGFYRHVSLIRN